MAHSLVETPKAHLQHLLSMGDEEALEFARKKYDHPFGGADEARLGLALLCKDIQVVRHFLEKRPELVNAHCLTWEMGNLFRHVFSLEEVSLLAAALHGHDLPMVDLILDSPVIDIDRPFLFAGRTSTALTCLFFLHRDGKFSFAETMSMATRMVQKGASPHYSSTSFFASPIGDTLVCLRECLDPKGPAKMPPITSLSDLLAGLSFFRLCLETHPLVAPAGLDGEAVLFLKNHFPGLIDGKLCSPTLWQSSEEKSTLPGALALIQGETGIPLSARDILTALVSENVDSELLNALILRDAPTVATWQDAERLSEKLPAAGTPFLPRIRL